MAESKKPVAGNTIQANRASRRFGAHERPWVFGYGSLIYKADFDYLACRRARIVGWQRRFWQGSHDHRGTPAAPGRVATLVAAPGQSCTGVAYRVAPAVFEHLDHREKNGYLRVVAELIFDDDSRADGLVYIAGPDNPAYLGQASISAIARQIAAAAGPSGANRRYLLDLAAALRRMGVADDHVFAIEDELLGLDAGR